MGSLTPIEELSRQIMDRLPSAHVSVDAPDDSAGNWYLDVEFESRKAVVEWRPRRGFGVSLEPAGYGEGPEIILPSARAAAAYVAGQLARRDDVNVLLASSDATWRGLLYLELKNQHVSAEVVGGYADVTRRLGERTYDVVVIDLPTDSNSVEYADLQKLLMRASALVVAVGKAHLDFPPEDWFEVFVRKAMAPSRIASIVESLAATGPTQIS